MSRLELQFQRISQWLLEQRRLVASLLIILLGLTIWQLPDLKVDNSISSWYAAGDPALEAYDHFLETFGNDDVILCGIRDSLGFDQEERVAVTLALQEGMEGIEGVDFVSSYLDFPFRYLSDGYLNLRRIYQEEGSLPAPSELSQWMAGNPFRDRLIGKDPNFVLLYVWPDTTAMPDEGRTVLLGAIDSLFTHHRLSADAELFRGGFGVVYEGINQATLSEGSFFLLLSYVVLILAMLVVSRSVYTTFLAVLVITFGNIALLGFMVMLGKPINLVTLALPPLIMVIGVSNFVHFILHAREQSRLKAQAADLLPIIAFVAVPITFNSLTTAGGFLSLTSSSIPITRDYGLLAAISILGVSLFSILAAVFFHRRLMKVQFRWDPSNKLSLLARKAMGWSISHYRKVLVMGLGLLILAILGIGRVQVDTMPLSFIPENHVVRSDHEVLAGQVGQYIPLEFVLRFNQGSWKQVSNFALLDQVQRQINADAAIGGSLSVRDFALDVYDNTPGHTSGGDPVNADRFSQRKLGIISSNLWQDPFIQRLTTRRGDELRIMTAISLTSARDMQAIQHRIAAGIEAEFGAHLTVTPSGYLPLYSRIVDTVVLDQVKSFLIAVIVVLFLMFLVLRSLRLTLIALPSNILPVVLILGTMGALGLPLDLVSVTLAATILGIIVDDSLHLLFNFRHQLAEGFSLPEATQQVARLTGAAVLSTSIILLLGYGIIAFSTVPILATTGRLMVLAVVAAVIADLLILPAVLRLVFSSDQGTSPTEEQLGKDL